MISQPQSYHLKYKERGKGKQVFPDSSPNRALKVKVSSKESLIKISFRLVVSSVSLRVQDNFRPMKQRLPFIRYYQLKLCHYVFQSKNLKICDTENKFMN